jgi:hypothetical protein
MAQLLNAIVEEKVGYRKMGGCGSLDHDADDLLPSQMIRKSLTL